MIKSKTNWKRLRKHLVVFVLLFGFLVLLGGCVPKTAESITLSKTEVTLEVGDKVDITATVLPNDLKEVVIEWSSNKNTVAYVNQTGEITAAGEGTAVITAKVDEVSATVTVVVLPIPEEYNVDFNSNGGNGVASQTVIEGSKVIKPSIPLKDGYLFENWYTDENLTSPFNFDTEITKDMVLYAKWDIVEYTVTFNTNEGTAVTAKKVEHGSKLSIPLVPKRTGYIFVGWFKDSDLLMAYDFNTVVESNFTLYAKWQVGKANVTFVSNGGTPTPSIEVTIGEKVSKPLDPSKDGNIFNAWYADYGLTRIYDFNAPVIGNINLYAKWDVDLSNFIKVEFEPNGGSFPLSSTNAFIKAGVDPVQLYEESIAFDGNMGEQSLYSSFVFILTSNRRSTWWSAAGLKKNDAGMYVVTKIVAAGLPDTGEFEDCDYIITAWTDSGSAHTFVNSIKVGQIVTALGFTEDMVPGAADGAAIYVYEQGANYAEINANNFELNDSLPVPVKSGNDFLGWYGTVDLSGEPITKVTESTKLYAKWELSSATVTFDVGTGSPVASQTIVGSGKATKPEDPTLVGYTFGGWYISTLYTPPVYDFDRIVDHDLTLYAHWIANE